MIIRGIWVYLWLNKVNGKYYRGSSKNPTRIFSQYFTPASFPWVPLWGGGDASGEARSSRPAGGCMPDMLFLKLFPLRENASPYGESYPWFPAVASRQSPEAFFY